MSYPQNTPHSLKCFLISLMAVVLIAGGCQSPQPEWQSPVQMKPQVSDAGPSVQPGSPLIESSTPSHRINEIVTAIQSEQQSSQPPILDKQEGSFQKEYGWILESTNGYTLQELSDKATDYKVTQIQLGGNIIQAVDDLILNKTKRDWIQQTARRMDAQNIDVLVYSREIHVEGTTFLFNRDAPLVAARQAAYRKAFQFVPEVDGVVLSFSGALLPCWEAVPPSGSTTLNPVDRIRFLIDMIRPIVVNELGKKLYIRLEAETPEQTAWIASALQSYSVDDFVVVLPSLPSGKPFQDPSADWISRFIDHRPLVEVDLTGKDYGGMRVLTGLSPDWKTWQGLLENEKIGGVVSVIGDPRTTLWNTLDEINLAALLKMQSKTPVNVNLLAEELINKMYNIAPLTREGFLLSRMIQNAPQWNAKIYRINGEYMISDHGTIPHPEHFTFFEKRLDETHAGEVNRYLVSHLQNPNRQLLIDLAQESTEAMEMLDQAIWDLEQLRPKLHPKVYNDLYKKLDYQRLLADVFHHFKQAVWGFEFWKQTRDEEEAVALEAHLQKLENLSEAFQKRFPQEDVALTPLRIQAWVTQIRHAFPRVIIGWKERNWNVINHVEIRQASPERVEIQWKSSRPSTAHLFISTQLPVFERMVTEKQYPAQDHKMMIDQLDANHIYYLKIQSKDEQGEITNSGIFTFQLESPPLM